jgi:hypothetical protein
MTERAPRRAARARDRVQAIVLAYESGLGQGSSAEEGRSVGRGDERVPLAGAGSDRDSMLKHRSDDDNGA